MRTTASQGKFINNNEVGYEQVQISVTTREIRTIHMIDRLPFQSEITSALLFVVSFLLEGSVDQQFNTSGVSMSGSHRFMFNQPN